MANQTQTAGQARQRTQVPARKVFSSTQTSSSNRRNRQRSSSPAWRRRDPKRISRQPFKKAGAVVRANFALLLKGSLWFAPAALVFMLVFLVAAPFFENYVMGSGYNFMQGVGVGLHPGGDNIAASVATLYWDVYQPLLMMLAGAGHHRGALHRGSRFTARSAPIIRTIIPRSPAPSSWGSRSIGGNIS